jgi:exonuclease VII small subunit
MKSITYLFGAGASAKALPVVGAIPEELDRVAKLFNTHYDISSKIDLGNSITKNLSECQSELELAMKRLVPIIKNHASVDTYAKKLYLQGNQKELTRLKVILSIFFTVLQSEGIKFEPRYDSFFASILEKLDDFPKNVKVLSWNYDQQFEMAYAEYLDSKQSLQKASKKLNVITKQNWGSIWKSSEDGFCIIKLNGSTGFVNDTANGIPFLLTEEKSHEPTTPNDSTPHYYNRRLFPYVINNLVEKYARIMSLFEENPGYVDHSIPLLSFAWEKENHEDKSIINEAMTKTENTDILVVVGYSFPYFNREIDKQIINNMPNLTKIYIQDLCPENIIQRLKTLINKNPNTINYVPNIAVEQFLLPNEL